MRATRIIRLGCVFLLLPFAVGCRPLPPVQHQPRLLTLPEVRAATARHPDVATNWSNLGWVLAREAGVDPFEPLPMSPESTAESSVGESRARALAEARDALRRAVAAAEGECTLNRIFHRIQLAMLLERSAGGLDEAIGALASALDLPGDEQSPGGAAGLRAQRASAAKYLARLQLRAKRPADALRAVARSRALLEGLPEGVEPYVSRPELDRLDADARAEVARARKGDGT